MKKVFLLDGHSLIHRAYYAIPELKTSKGLVTNAAYGFSLMLMRLLEELGPDYIAVAFDMEGPTFRHKKYGEYKATRDKTPEDLSPQFNLVRRILQAFQIPIYEELGYEADDVIGTIGSYCQRQNLYTVVVTGDRDALQLVSPTLEVMYTRKGITDVVNYTLDKVLKDYGLQPELLVDMKGLMGDSSDNIPGVDGIGEKTALKLLHGHGSLEKILENIESVPGKKRRETLNEQKDRALMSRELALIVKDVPLKIDLEAMDYRGFNHQELKTLFQELEFKNLLSRLGLSEAEEKEREREEGLISLQEIKEEKDLSEMISSIKKRGWMALELLLEDRPLFYIAPQKNLLFSYDHRSSSIELTSFLHHLKEVLEDTSIQKYIPSAKEALLFFRNHQIEVLGLHFEPSIAAYLIDPGGRIHTLDEILEEYSLKSPSKELRPQERLSYLFSLKEKMEERLLAMDLEDLYYRVELPLVPTLVEMEKNGISIDEKVLKEIAKDLGGRLLALRIEACALAGGEFNLNSPKQLGKVLFEDLKLPVLKKTKTGYSTAASVLEDLKDHHPIIPLILQYRQLMKLKSTYVESLLELRDNKTHRIHTTFQQLVTATGRLSSTEPNLQNIPIRTEEGRKIRGAFVPKGEDYLLLTADYSQVELRVLAHISGDEGLKEAFSKGEDIHTNTASQVFSIPKEDVDREHRRRAKAINFGIAYGMSAYGLSQDLDITRDEAQAYIDSYFYRYPKVKEYIDSTIEKTREEGCVRTLLGRIRLLPDIKSRNRQKRSLAERMAINTPIQGSAADIIKLAMVEVYRMLKESTFHASLLLQVHDELVFEVQEEEVEDLGLEVKRRMEGALQLDVPLIVDLKAGHNWRDTEIFTL